MAQNPWDEDEIVGQQNIPQGPIVPPLPPSPQERRQEQRQDIQTSISQENLRLRQQAEQRAREAQALQQQANARANQAEKRAQAQSKRGTVEQGKAAAFLERALGANTQYNELGIGPRSWVAEKAYGVAPDLVNTMGGNSPERQRADALQREFVSAILRYDSGAAIPPAEIDNAIRTYFPTPGESDAVIAQKAQMRTRALQGLVSSSGPLGPQVIQRFEQERRRQGNALMQDTTTGTPGGETRMASGNNRNKVQPIPDAMQQEYAAYVQQRRGQLDPDQFVQYMDTLDKKYGFAGNDANLAEKRRQWATDANDIVSKGGTLNLRIPPAVMPMTALDRVNSKLFNNPLGAGILASPPLAGGMDEVAAGIRSATGGGTYQQELALTDAMRQNLANEFPKATLGGSLLGGVAGGATVGMAAPRAAGLLSTIPGGAAMGSASGALEMNDNRMLGAGIGAGAGGAGTAVGRYLLPPLANTGQRAASQVLPNVRAPNRLDEAQKAIDLKKLADARQAMQDARNLDFPLSISDLNRSTRSLGGAAARFSEDAANLAEQTFDPRQANRAGRLGNFINERMAPGTDIKDMARQLRSAGYQQSTPDYEAVFARAAPVSDEINSILQTRNGKDALQRAYEIAENEGINPRSIGFDLNEQGEVVLTEGPSMRTLDMVKRGLDDIISDGRDPVTGKVDFTGKPRLKSVDNLRSRLVSELDRIEPKYKDARAIYEEYAKQAEALERGFELGGKDIPERDFARIVADMGDAEKEYFRRGYATRLQDRVRSTADQSDPYRSFVDKQSYRSNMGLLFPDAMDDLGKLRGLERMAQKTNQEVLGGSQTQPRKIADEMFKRDSAGQVATDLGIDLATGSGGMATAMGRARGLLQGVNDRRLIAGEKRASEMAPALYNTDPQQNIRWLDDLEYVLGENGERLRKQRRAGGLLGSFIGAGTVPSLLSY